MGRKSKFTLEERISMCKDYLEMGLSRKDIFIKFINSFSSLLISLFLFKYS